MLFVVALVVGVFGLVSSAALAIRIGYPLGDVTPWLALEYAWSFGLRPEVRSAAGIGAIAGALAPLLLLVRPAVVDFGRARFATRREVRTAGLFAPTGVIVGRIGRELLRSAEPLHVLVAAPTRSGKGAGVVIPNLLSWTGSALVLDIKGENFEITSRFRAEHGQRVFRFSPGDTLGRSHRYNPLSAVRAGPTHRISDLQRLAAVLLPAPLMGKDSFWQDEARSLFVGLALVVLDTEGVPGTLGQIYRTLTAREPLHRICEHLVETEPELNPACRQALVSYAQKAEKERSGVRSTLTAALGLWANPAIDAATSESDFSFADLRRQPTTVYVAVSLDQLEPLRRLLNCFFQQAIGLLSQRRPDEHEPHEVLMLLDEFASLGRMSALQSSLAFLAGFGVRVCTIVQGLGQLDELYGRGGRESILQNSALQVLFAANDETTARYVSERLGRKTIRTTTRSYPGGGRLATKTIGYAERALLLPEEVRGMGAEEALVFREGMPAIQARKLRYYEERAFDERLLGAAAVPELEMETWPEVDFGLEEESADASALEEDAAAERDQGGCYEAEVMKVLGR